MTSEVIDSKNGACLDELALCLKAGEPGAALKLWDAVRRFVEMKARKRAAAHGCRAQADDLTQAGFLAMLETAAQYEPGEGKNFLSALSFSLMKAFAAEEGIRTTRRDALQYADSTEAATFRDNSEGETVGDLLPDDGAALAFVGVEYVDFLDYCRREIRAALDTLPPEYAALLRLHYLEGRTLEAAAPLCGFLSKQTASEAEERALRRLERGKHRLELWECLTAFEDFEQYREAARYDKWKTARISRTEAAAVVKS